MNTALNIFNAVWPLIALGGGATVVTQVLKRVTKLEKNSVIIFLFHSVTVVTTLITYLLGSHALSLGVLAVHGGAISGFANALYPVVKWMDGKLAKINQALKIVNQDLPQVEQTVGLPASAPIQPDTHTTGLPTAAQNTNTPPPPADF
jgi:hypothetical protein